ncbi:hypothetical protein PVT68_10960 [Microbulbifer bruguierae]|uniref:DUF1579 domain-containing protein n=1 Tax=Microbulbifer bruguierae TaxID=3029061 RepID=A0ABY8NA36_9GAMM|nr:hypothetical protein [Microbulbifer bruguierae]WGL15289.1 hypothetical protein PVT68_10960 [Microbulbifer bruguierae]
MKLLRQLSFRPVLLSLLQAYVLVLAVFFLLPALASAQEQTSDQAIAHRWAGNWLVVGQGDEQLVWQLKADGTGFAHGFRADGQLTHGFAISWRIEGDTVRIRTGGTLHCNSGMVYAQFTGWSPVTLDFNVIDGRHWRQHNGGILAFQRRLPNWQTPNHGAECPNLYRGERKESQQTASADN